MEGSVGQMCYEEALPGLRHVESLCHLEQSSAV